MLYLDTHYHGIRIYVKLSMYKLCKYGIYMFISPLPYLVPAGDQGRVEHLTLWSVPVDVFINLLSFFSEVKELKCPYIRPPQKVQCVHMYSVA